MGFLPTLGQGSTSIDDELSLVDNPHDQGCSARSSRWMWTTRHAGHIIPFTAMTLAADFQRSGLDPRD